MYGYGKHELECDNSSKGWWKSHLFCGYPTCIIVIEHIISCSDYSLISPEIWGKGYSPADKHNRCLLSTPISE
jgi:hypothetical protein